MEHQIDKARIADVAGIHKMVNKFADSGQMLHRPLAELYEHIRDFYVIRENEKVIACAALHVSWADLAEIKSLAVDTAFHHKRLGYRLVQTCVNEANDLGIEMVFSLTYFPEFFEKCGFSRAEKSSLPHKVWGECYHCPKFPNCDETAVVLHTSRRQACPT